MILRIYPRYVYKIYTKNIICSRCNSIIIIYKYFGKIFNLIRIDLSVKYKIIFNAISLFCKSTICTHDCTSETVVLWLLICPLLQNCLYTLVLKIRTAYCGKRGKRIMKTLFHAQLL